MARDRIGNQIETWIEKNAWKQARTAIESQLRKEPDDHWLWARLSAVKYEQRDYQGALEAAGKALEIVPDCPLALWSYAGAVEMLGRSADAMDVYARLLQRGLEELKHPDRDANECWEGPDWTAGLMEDCLFRIAGCLALMGRRDGAVEMYRGFLGLADLGARGIYSREDALKKLKKLLPTAKARREAALKAMETEKRRIAT
jgi:tetratricopeptide (TPR) repeat protein